MRIRPDSPQRAALLALTALLIVTPPIALTAATWRQPSAAPASTAPASTAPASPPAPPGAPAVSQPSGPGAPPPGPGAPPRRLLVPDLVVVTRTPLNPEQVAGIGRLTGVRAVLPVDGGQAILNGRATTILGVDPVAFRMWTPPGTAAATGIWAALQAGNLVLTNDAATRLGLTLGSSYQVTGSATASLPFTAIAPSGIPGADAIVDRQRSAQLGLAPDVALLISAPGADYATLIRRIRLAVAGPASVLNLVPRPASLPVTSGSPGRPASWLELYRDSAAGYCPGLSWTVLAAISEIESGQGANDGPSSAGALGPMQFMPATWAAWGIDGFGPAGPPDIMNPLDAVPSAARMLCADGASRGSSGLAAAIWDYNHAGWYVTEVLQLAAEYARDYP